MKKTKGDPPVVKQTAMQAGYDFTGKKGIRGRYYETYRQGHEVRVTKTDGSVSVQHFTLEDGAVLLEPNVRRYFPDSDTVNAALRGLIALIPAKTAKKAPVKSSRETSTKS